MRDFLAFIRGLIAGLDRRSRRWLVFGCAACLTFFAGTTAQAARAGDMPDATAGALLLAGIAALAATASTARAGD